MENRNRSNQGSEFNDVLQLNKLRLRKKKVALYKVNFSKENGEHALQNQHRMIGNSQMMATRS